MEVGRITAYVGLSIAVALAAALPRAARCADAAASADTGRASAAAPAPAATPRPLVIAAIGDSITAGTTRSGRPGGGPDEAQRDPEGGYPGRLPRSLGGEVRVVNRGAGGATTRFWLDAPAGDPAAVQRFAEALWPDFHPAAPPHRGQSLLAYVLESERPDVVLLLVGVNDLAEAGGAPPDPAAIAARIERLAGAARASGAQVLVGTLLPNRRDPAAAISEVNRRLCIAVPDCVATGDAFAAAGGASLLGDEVHPKPDGHAAIARAFAAALAARGVAAAGGAAPSPQRTGAVSPAAP